MEKEKLSAPEWYREARKILAQQDKVDEVNEQAILILMKLAANEERRNASARLRRKQKQEKVIAAKKLLLNYHKLQSAVESSVARVADVMDDTEIERLMMREDSIKNQQVRSLAIQAATTRVLFLQVTNALEEMKSICRADQNPRFRRQYDFLCAKYIQGHSTEQILSSFGIERSEFYRTQQEALQTFSVLLFGATTVSDFFPEYETVEGDSALLS